MWIQTQPRWSRTQAGHDIAACACVVLGWGAVHARTARTPVTCISPTANEVLAVSFDLCHVVTCCINGLYCAFGHSISATRTSKPKAAVFACVVCVVLAAGSQHQARPLHSSSTGCSDTCQQHTAHHRSCVSMPCTAVQSTCGLCAGACLLQSTTWSPQYR
jgi:hypothetical protein